MSIPDLARVGAFLEEVAGEHMLPFWRRLAPGEVTAKATASDPADVVTTVDLAVEGRLTRGLRELLPGSAAVGEEAVHADPLLLGALGGDGWTWLIDPLDGTRNFVGGEKDFCVYYRLLPWDHAPGALILQEANGAAEHLDGARYAVASRSQVTVIARSRGIAGRIRRVLSAGDDR
ncbi:inositol monophosphatase family protein [Sorangium sp. So ce269]